ETLPTLLSTLLNRSQISPSQIALELTEREFADPKTSAPIVARSDASRLIEICCSGWDFNQLPMSSKTVSMISRVSGSVSPVC
ncbi:hypothetical protein KU406_24360, partial [Salmonella enterica subsp. enterica serovar Montevideo]|nr:hypothetical protein [Salmonella enterica subsp. enterica serovar Montevideo]